jgi:hypothetical protein
VVEGKSWKNCYTVPDVHFFLLHMGRQQPLQMLKVVSGKLEYGQLTQKYLKTSYSLLQTTNKHILNPNEDQLSDPTPSGHALYSSSAPSEAEQS